MGMGRYVKITGIMGEGKYAAVHGLSNEIFYATVDRKFRNNFNPMNRSTPSGWCPFLMDSDEDGNYMCSVYDTAPPFCKDFKCCTCRIYDKNGNPSGTVKGRTTLTTDDPVLEKIWNDAVNAVVDMEAEGQRLKIAEILKESGYDARFC